MKYYLSGAITGVADLKSYFKHHEEELWHWGLNDTFNPASTDWPKDVRWETCMKYDIKILMDCDCLVLLPNWRKSRGAKLEVHLAKTLGIRVVKFNELIRGLMANAS